MPTARPIEIKLPRHARARLAERAPGLNLRALLEAHRDQLARLVQPGAGRFMLAGLTPVALPVLERQWEHGPLLVVTVLAPGSRPSADTRVLQLA